MTILDGEIVIFNMFNYIQRKHAVKSRKKRSICFIKIRMCDIYVQHTISANVEFFLKDAAVIVADVRKIDRFFF